MRAFLLVYCLFFFGILFALPKWWLQKRFGIRIFVLPTDDSVQGFIGFWFKALIGGMFLFAGSLAAGLDVSDFGPLRWLQFESLQWIGAILIVFSTLWIALAQYQMGSSLRVGYDPAQTPDLVTNGLFARSRNPIFLGMRVSLWGLFLVLPCSVTLAMMVAAEALLGIQVRLEEDYLRQSLGADYEAYLKRTPRWLCPILNS